MDVATVFTRSAVRRPLTHAVQSAASFIIIARRVAKTVRVLAVDCPDKYGVAPDGRILRRIGFSGGKAEYNETSQQTAEREVLEEVGLQVNLDSPTSELIFELNIIGEDVRRKRHIFRVFSSFEFSGKIVLGEDVKDAFWVPVQDLLNRKNLLEKHKGALEIFARRYT
jgi:8-oxo-dGTP pyrophosphatase MutT (NUDIX family)